MMYYFCTYFDQYYLSRGLALYHSLQQHCPAFQLWVLCMDQASYEILAGLKLPHLRPIALNSFERGDTALLQAKTNRSQVEYYFTCTPSLPLYILKNWPEVDLITYLDADLFFYADPAPLYTEMGTGSVAIIAHRYPPHLRQSEQYGIYNVGWLSFRRDENGLACLQWWRERCLEWCYDRLEPDRFADQKYLDRWTELFAGVVVLSHKGANLAPWNLTNYRIYDNPAGLQVDDQPLIFYHFQGLKQINRWVYKSGLAAYQAKSNTVIRRRIYAPYIQALHAAAPRGFQSSSSRWGPPSVGLSYYAGRLLVWPDILKRLLAGDYILVLQ